MTWIFYAKCDDDELTSTYVAWYKISVQLAIIIIMEILTPTIDAHLHQMPHTNKTQHWHHHRTKYNAGIDEEEESLDQTPQAAWQVSFCKYKYVTFDALRTYSKLFIDLIEVELKPLACGRW
jgi:hypothetical protein